MYKKPNIFRKHFSFSGEIGVGEFWSEFCVRVIEFLCLSVVVCILICVLLPLEVEQLSLVMDIAVAVMGIVWMVGIAALSRRRLRDAGYGPKTYFWLLLPVVGWIVVIVRLLQKSK